MLLDENTLTASILNLFLPPVCPLCEQDVRAAGSPFCGACHGELCSMLIKGPVCTVCGAPFASGASGGHTCGDCLTSPPPLVRSLSVFAFAGEVREAVHRLKYSGSVILGAPLGRMFRYLPEGGVDARLDIIMPVPLHVRRLRSRSFNQSLLLARGAARIIPARLDYGNLERVRFTEQQVNLPPKERQRNVTGAFALKRPAQVNGKKVALVDDVYTTGATIRECAKVLKKAGAEVYALTLARAVSL
ncbi:MAG: double zinc ribbon domain-containing protein [Thermodesulfobacteriota bacterium]